MAWKYEKNFTDRGYLMKYSKHEDIMHVKNMVCQFIIELEGITPKIWRRIQVPAGYNFWDLHVAIADSMGWLDYHIHYFEIRGKGKRKTVHIGIPDFDRNYELQEVYPGWEIWMLSYFNEPGIEAKYFYDYGDGWEHRVKLEGYMHKEKSIKYPVCIDGARACPPEDCGGISGYYNVLEVLADPGHEEHEKMRLWAGKNWDPEHFDTKEVKFDHPYQRWKYAFLES